MDPADLLRACRPGHAADDALAAALTAGSVPVVEAEAPASELARTCRVRVEHLAKHRLLLSNKETALEDLSSAAEHGGVVLALAFRHDERTVTALVGRDPDVVLATFVHAPLDRG